MHSSTQYDWRVLLFLIVLPVASMGCQARQIISDEYLQEIDVAILEAIDEGALPGAVVLITHQGDTVYRKAFGNRSLDPAVEPMTTETIFDLASLTKVIATAPSVMALIDDVEIHLHDAVSN